MEKVNNKEFYDKLADEAWQSILSSVKDLKNKNHTFEEIAHTLNIKNRALVCEWVNGKREISRTAFANILYYLDILGYALHGNSIVKKTDITDTDKESNIYNDLLEEMEALKKENKKLTAKLKELKENISSSTEPKKKKKKKNK